MVEAGGWSIVDLVCKYRLDLPRILVGGGHDYLAERHAPVPHVYPMLFRRSLLGRRRLGPMQAATRTLDQCCTALRVSCRSGDASASFTAWRLGCSTDSV